MANVIWRGPLNREDPQTVNKPVTGALLPGTMVEETATALAQITTGLAKRPLILSNNPAADQDTLTAYVSGNTGIAYAPRPGDVFQCAMAAATYTLNQELTIAASGRLAAATSGTLVFAWFRGTPGAISAGALVDIEIANAYIKA